MNVHLLPLAALFGSAAAVFNGAVSTSSPYIDGDALINNLKTNWPIYLGVPVGVAVAGQIAKGAGGNPGLKLGSFSVKLW